MITYGKKRKEKAKPRPQLSVVPRCVHKTVLTNQYLSSDQRIVLRKKLIKRGICFLLFVFSFLFFFLFFVQSVGGCSMKCRGWYGFMLQIKPWIARKGRISENAQARLDKRKRNEQNQLRKCSYFSNGGKRFIKLGLWTAEWSEMYSDLRGTCFGFNIQFSSPWPLSKKTPV